MTSTKSRQSSLIEQLPRRRICTSWIVPLLLLWMLPTALGLMMAGRVSAQTFTTLHSFDGGSDGANPVAGLILLRNTLFGTASSGGTNGSGTVFAVNTDGSGFTVLHSFTATDPSTGTNSDGVSPQAGLILSGNTLYGTASAGGSSGYGTVFAVNIDGTGFTVLHTFTALSAPYYVGGTNSDGANPYAGLILSGNTLYGTASAGGTNGSGTVFAVNTDGSGFTTLHSSDGANPNGLILSGNTLYGTAEYGGDDGNGTVFAVNTDGSGFTTLHFFDEQIASIPAPGGSDPDAGLILLGNTLYGTARFGGDNGNGTDFYGNGTVFAVNTNGAGFRNLHSFTGGSGGTYPKGGLILSGNTLYGTAGTVFAVNTDGTGFTTLHSFSATDTNGFNSDGNNPVGGLILTNNTLYGTAQNGGTNGSYGTGAGTVFSIFIQPQLTMIPSGPYVILTWPTNYSGFTLQSTTNFASSAVWSTNSSPPFVIGGENVVINTTSGKQHFYRLSQ